MNWWVEGSFEKEECELNYNLFVTQNKIDKLIPQTIALSSCYTSWKYKKKHSIKDNKTRNS